MSAYAAALRERFSDVAPAEVLGATTDLGWFYGGLVVATALPALVVLVATTGRRRRAGAWAVVFVQSVFVVNVVVPHVPAAVLLGGYAPGVATAVAIELPYGVYFLRRSVRERAVSKVEAALAVGLAVPALVVGLGAVYVMAVHLVSSGAAPN